MKTMCMWCLREPYKPHLANCPELTGLRFGSVYHRKSEKKTGAYLRRGRHPAKTPLPITIYLVETRAPDPDTPAGMYAALADEPIAPRYTHLAERRKNENSIS